MFLDEYEINRTMLLAIAAVAIAALSVYVIFNVVYASQDVNRPIAKPVNPQTSLAFDAVSCSNLLSIGSFAPSMSIYYANYHIDGSSGDAVEWNASGQPPDKYSPLTLPDLFFVYSGNEFEGCGSKREINNNNKVVAIKSLFNFSSCQGSQIHISKQIKESYEKFDIYIIEPDGLDKYTIATVLVSPKYEYGNEILQSLGCLA